MYSFFPAAKLYYFFFFFYLLRPFKVKLLLGSNLDTNTKSHPLTRLSSRVRVRIRGQGRVGLGQKDNFYVLNSRPSTEAWARSLGLGRGLGSL